MISSKLMVSITVGVIVLFTAAYNSSAHAVNHFVAATTSVVDCDTYGGGVRAGDTLTLAGGGRGAITFQDCKGTSGNHVTIRNDTAASGPVRISSNRTFIFHCIDCEHLTIDGSGGWVGMPAGAHCGSDKQGTAGCGIQIGITGNSVTAMLRMAGSSSDFTIKGVEMDGNSFGSLDQGIDVNDHDYENWPAQWRENILITENYIHHVSGAGMYIGPNWLQGGLNDLRLRNVEISHNYVTNTGDKGIALKSAIEGKNTIHHNVVENSGLAGVTHGFGTGIACYEGACDIFSNRVLNAGESGIANTVQNVPAQFGPFKSSIYNNVVVNSGVTGPLSGNGITIAKSGDGGSSIARIEANIYNNTVVTTEAIGISINAKNGGNSCAIYNNIVADAGGSSIAPQSASMTSNLSGSIAQRSFVSPATNDFQLRQSSDAVDSASTGFPEDDIDGVRRAQGAGADVGAHEWLSATGQPPAPPIVQ